MYCKVDRVCYVTTIMATNDGEREGKEEKKEECHVMGGGERKIANLLSSRRMKRRF